MTSTRRSTRFATVLFAILFLPSLAHAGIKGRVTASDAPVPGALITAVPFQTPLEAARQEARGTKPPAPLAEVKSGPDGTFELSVPSTAGKAAPDFLLQVRAAGYIPLRSQAVFAPADTEELGDIPLVKGEPLTGVVVDPAAKPVKGAIVQVIPGLRGARAPAGFISIQLSTETGEDGRFQLEGLSRESNLLCIEAPGLVPFGQLGYRPASGSRRFTLLAGKAVTFQIVKTDRKTPAAGALACLGGGAVSPWKEASPEGRVTFLLPVKPKGSVVADGEDSGWVEQRIEKLPADLTKPIIVALKPVAGAEGRVVDAESGKNLPRVKVFARSGDGVLVTRTGPDGRYRLKPLSPGNYELVADDPKYVLYSRNTSIGTSQTRKVDFPLTLGAAVSGKVTDENGAAVAGAEGKLEKQSDASLPPFMRGASRAKNTPFVSGRDGAFSARRLTPGNGLRIQFRHPEFQPGNASGLSLASGAQKTGVTVVLMRGHTLTGSVKDTEGQPVAGAEVAVQRQRTATGTRMMRLALFQDFTPPEKAVTGADGRFEFKGLSPGDFGLSVRRDGYARAAVDSVKISPEEVAPPVDIVLKPGVAILVRVLKKSGEPADGLFLRAAESGRGAPGAGLGRGPNLDQMGPSQSDGTIVVDGLESGKSYDLSLMTRSGPVEKKAIPAPSENVEFVLPGVGGVSGRVVDSDGRPVPEFDVLYNLTTGQGGGVFRGSSSPQRFEAPDGQFSLEEVPAGTCTIRARATGYQEGWAGNVQVEEGAIKDGVEIRLQKSVKLVGRVTAGGTGRAVPDANVSILAAESGGGPRSTMSGGAGLVTDADGRFEAESLPGKYRVEVTHPSYATASQNAEVTQQGGSVEVKLGKGGVLGGMVIADDRKPVTDAEVSLRESGDSGRGGPFSGSNSTGTDATGRFRFENLSPGRYRATAARRESSSEPVETVVDVSTVKEDLVLTLASGATIRGLVSGVAEGEKARIGVVAQGPSDFFASALTDSQGQFEIRGAPEGVIRLSATLGNFTSGSQNSSAQVTITAGQKEVPAEIVFKNEASLSGRVLRNGQGVAGVTVMASPAAGGRLSAGNARTDDQGNYRIEGLDNGECNVYVMTGFGGGGGKSEKVNISGETQHDFVLPTARVTGQVLESGTRQPLSNVSIVATVASGTDSAGRMLPRGVSDSSGRFTLEGLEPGRYSIRAERQGYQADKREIEASLDNATPVTIEMVRGQGLALEVRDGIYNIPLRSVMVRAEDSSARSSYVGQVSLDQEGRGEISSLQPGTYKIWVASSGYALSGIAVSVPGPAAAVRLTPGGRIIVNAGPKTLALPSPRYKLLMPSGEPMPSVYGSGDTWRRIYTGLEMENIPPGSYTFAIDGGETRSVNVTEGGLTVVDVP